MGRGFHGYVKLPDGIRVFKWEEYGYVTSEDDLNIMVAEFEIWWIQPTDMGTENYR